MDNNLCNPKTIRKVEVFGVLLSLVIIATLIYGIVNIGNIGDTIKEEIYYLGIPGIILSSMFLDFFPQLVSPFIVLASAIIAGFNPHLAILFVILGSSIGATLGFILGKKYMFVIANRLISQNKIKKMTLMMNKYGKWAVSLTAISPLPYLPILIGALNFSKRNFIIYGLIPRAIGLTIFGYLISIL